MNTDHLLKDLAEKYETESFLDGDPSWFMHQVVGNDNREIMAFIASSLSYGSRKQFMPKIQFVLDASGGNVSEWVRSGEYRKCIPDNEECYYRLYNNRMFRGFLSRLKAMLDEYGTIGNYVGSHADNGLSAVGAITRWFAEGNEKSGIIPKNTVSACKRVCMFLRWMVRDDSPVDLGIWTEMIDKRTLIIPMDTHVLQEAEKLGLIKSRIASMANAIKLTRRLSEVFPDDPLKADFALFGYGVSK